MDSAAVDRIYRPLPIPAPGQATRLRCGSRELVLERQRSALTLLVHDGSEARRYVLGAVAGRIGLRLVAPPHPIQVEARDTLVLPPGTRWRGYLEVPLRPCIVWAGAASTPAAPETVLVDLGNRDLATEWDEEHGASHRCTSPVLTRLVPVHTGLRAVVPLVLHNRAPTPVLPGALPLLLRDRELHELRGRIVAWPRRVVLRDPDSSCEAPRPFGVLRRAATAPMQEIAG